MSLNITAIMRSGKNKNKMENDMDKLGRQDRLNLRISKEITKCARIKAIANDTTITEIVTKALLKYIEEPAIPEKH